MDGRPCFYPAAVVSTELQINRPARLIRAAIEFVQEETMEFSGIIAGLDEEITRLRGARNLLIGSNGRSAPRVQKKHTMSEAGRARIVAAQRARWAKQKKTTK
jgi:hypothetical protein